MSEKELTTKTKNHMQNIDTRGMMNRWRNLLLGVILLPGMLLAQQPVAQYIFTQTPLGYFPITGGTVVAAATGTSGATGLDDVNYNGTSGTTIPFSFTFGPNATAFTALNINSNGYVTFGATLPSTTLYTPLSSTTGYLGVISALARDLRGIHQIAGDVTTGSAVITNVINTQNLTVGNVISGTGIPTGTTIVSFIPNTSITMSANATSSAISTTVSVASGEIRTETLGTSPNQTFVIQFKNFQPFAAVNSLVNFQIRLKEAGGVAAAQSVDIIYGNTYYVSATSGAPQVGLRGTANTDYNNRTGTVWSSSVAGTINTASMSWLNGSNPALGQGYSWKPATCFPPTSISVLNITNTSADVSFTASAGAGSYIVEYGPVGFTPGTGATAGGGTVVTGAASPIALTGLTTATAYAYYVRKNCGAGDISSNSSVGYFNTNCSTGTVPHTQDFSAAVVPNMPPCVQVLDLNAGNTWVTAVNTTPFSNNVIQLVGTTTAADDWFFLRPLTLTLGTSYRLTFKYGNTSTVNAANLFATYGSAQSAASQTNSIVSIPSILTGSTVAATSQTDFVHTGATGVYYIGFRTATATSTTLRVDDVAVTITPLCFAPTAVTVGSITATSASVGFTCNSCLGSYLVEYGLTGFTPGSGATAGAGGTVVTGGSTPIAISGLSAQTNYQVYVRENCGVNGYSANSTVAAFTTPCAAFNAPWSDSFESNTTDNGPILPCFSGQIITGTATSAWRQKTQPQTSSVTVGARTGTKYMTATWSTNSWLFSPGINLAAGQSYDFSFWYAQSSTVNGFTLNAAVGTSNTAVGMTTALGTITNVVNTTYANAKYTYVAPAAGVYYFGLQEVETTGSPWYILTDDWSVTATPLCVAPTTVAVNTITQNSANVTWACASCTGSFIMEYGATGFTPGTGATAGTGGTVVTAASSPGALTSLASQTTYQVYVRQNCTGAGNGYSPNAGPVSFTTACGATNVPYTQNFDGAVPCLLVQNVGNLPNTWVLVTAPAGYTGSIAQYPWDGTNPANDWLYIQGLNLTAGTSYRLQYKYGNNSTGFTESMKVAYGTSPTAASMTTVLANHPTINQNTPQFGSVDFTPATSGVYYMGFHAYSIADQFNLFLDDISVTLTPLCNPVTALGAAASGPNTANVAWTCASCTGPYVVEYGAPGFTPGAGATAGTGGTIVGAASSPAAVGGLASGTTYSVYVRQNCSGVYSTNTGPVNFTTDPSCGNTWYDAGGPGTILNTSAVVGSYPNSIALGSKVTTICPTTPGDLVTATFSQFNTEDGFDPLYIYNGNSTASPKVASANAAPSTTPNDGAGGWTNSNGTNMAVWPSNTSTAGVVTSSDASGCLTFQQISDGSVNYQGWTAAITCAPPPACPAVTAMSVSAVTANTANVNFTCTGCTGSYIVEYGAPGFTPGLGATAGTGGTIVTGASSPVNITGLAAQTAYQVYVRQDCSGASNGYSTNSSPQSFTTLCNAFVAPYTQNFDGMTAGTTGFFSCITTANNLSQCWTNQSGNVNNWHVYGPAGTPSTSTGPSADHTNPGTGFYVYQEGSGCLNTTTSMFSPVIDVTPLTVPYLRFWYHQFGTGSGTTAVYISDDGGASFIATPIFTVSGDQGDIWKEVKIALPSYAGQNDLMFEFRGLTGTSVNPDKAIDDFSITEAPACLAVNSVTVSNLMPTSAQVNWACAGCTGTFIMEYGAPGFTPGLGATAGTGGTIVTAAASPGTITGLTAQTSYQVYVRQDCGGIYSTNSNAVSFTTPCNAFTAPYAENFNSAVATFTPPTCWSNPTPAGGEQWRFAATPLTGNYPSPVNDHTPGGGTKVAWIDASLDVLPNTLISPFVNWSALTAPEAGFWFLANNTNTTVPIVQHGIRLEVWDGAAWLTMLSYFGNNPNWIELKAAIPAVPTTTQFRIVGVKDPANVGSGTYFYKDLFVDDFFVANAPACPAPVSLSVSSITGTSASVSWTCATCAGPYIMEYGAPGFTPGLGATAGTGGTIVSAVSSPGSLTGLTPGTSYQVYVRQNCTGASNGYSLNVGPASFTTTCTSFNVPWTDSFESNTTDNGPILPCFTGQIITGTATSAWRQKIQPQTSSVTVGARTGTDYMTATWNTNSWLFSPGINLASGQSYDFSFWYAQSSTTVGYTLNAAVGTVNTAAGMTTSLGSIVDVVNTSYAQAKYTYVAPAAGVYYFGLQEVSTTSSPWYILTDDWKVETTPLCPSPSAITTTNVTGSSAQVNWTCVGCTGSYVVEYGAPGFTPGTGATAGTGGTVILAATSPAVIPGLTGSTAYQVYVRQNCTGAGNGYSTNGGPANFTTGVDCATSPIISCGADVTTTFAGAGTWQPGSCGFATPGQERVFRFTAPVAGTYQLQMNGGTGGYVDWFFKSAAGTCDATGWTCILDITSTTSTTNFTIPTAGNYYILGDPESSTTAYTKIFRINCPATNVSCASADLITCGASVTGNTTGGTNTLPATACPFNGAASTGGVNWWVYTATADQDVIASTCGQAAFNSRISVFKPTTSCSDLVCVAQNDDVPGCTNGSSEVIFPVTTGSVYYIAVHGAATGSFTMSLTCAPSCTPASGNATCSSAAPLTTYLADGSGTMMTDDNTCGYSDSPTSCSGANPVQGLWYTFTTGTRTRFRLTLQDNSVNAAYTATSMSYALYSGACSGNGAGGQIACVAAGAGTSILPVLQPSNTYRLLVYNTGGTGVQGTYAMLLEYFGENDASIASVLTPSGTICGSQFQSVVVLKNNGSAPLSAVTINANIDGGPTVATVNWTGFLGFGQQTSIVLPIVTTTSGPHVFNVYTTLPNGMTDEIAGNDQASSSYDSNGEAVKMHIITDNKGGETTWVIYDDFFLPVANGGPYTNNANVTENFCLSTNYGSCYYMYVFDSFGDGMCCAFGNGSWEMLDAFNQVILKDDGVFTTQSPSLAPFSPSYFAHEFCLPLGPSGPAAGECGVFTNKLLDKVYCKPISGVSTYQFEFSNPNAGFIRRIALPTNYVRFSQMQTNPLTPGTSYFCRVKADQGFIGAFFDDNFGPGCEMGLDPSQVPGCTQLIDNPALPTHSCGVNKQFGGSDKIWAVPVVGASQYRFRFVNATENYVRNITRPSYVCLMSWFTNPLSVGVTYEVTVDVFVNGVWSGFCGNTCFVTVAPSASPVSLREVAEQQQSVMLWPNPARADYVQILVDDMTDETQSIAVDVYDQTGKRVVAQQYQNTGSSFNTVLELNSNMASGMYMVHVTVNGKLSVEKLTIQ